jgi:glutamate:GABA antiporter
MESKATANSTKALTTFSLMMITIGSVDSIRNLPTTALFGSQLIFFFVFGALFFLIPAALVSAELASTWPKQGGVYIWVKNAFNTPIAFLAIWLQWIENVIWYPTILSFVAGTIGYLLNPAMATNKFFLVSVILASFWGTTVVNLLGMKSSARFSTLCTIAGLIVPMTLIISLGATWLWLGHPVQIDFSPHNLIPHGSESNLWVALTGIMLSFCGIEIATVHANDVEDPQRAFPRALIYSVAVILGTLILGSLAIAIVVPQAKISLVAGIMEACQLFLNSYHLQWMLPLIGASLVLGGLGSVSNWIIAPTKGLLVAAEDGNLPPQLQKCNRHGAPTYILIYQAIIVTVLSMVFLTMPSINGSYWLLTALGAQLYMLMYILMFVAAIVLRIKHPEKRGAFRVPGGNTGLFLVAITGIFGCALTFTLGFIPPSNIHIGSTEQYETLLLFGLVLMCLPPVLSYWFKKPSWLQAVPQT